VPDDDRKRRRVGDETQGRIADLASGWNVEPAAAAEPASAPAPASRKKPRTVPPPPPGSPERKALEQAIVETKGPEVAPRPKLPTTPPPIPAAALRKGGTGPHAALPGAPSAPVPRVIVDSSIPHESGRAAPPSKLAVPVGEFDGGRDPKTDDKLRQSYAHATIKRDVANALLGIADPPDRPADPSASGLATAPFARGDPTAQGERDDATTIEPPSAIPRGPTGRLRTIAALRRKRGLVGDIYYVSTALLGMRRLGRELAALEARQQVRQTSRRHHLITLGRTAVSTDAFDHAALAKAREALQAVEEERSQHAGQVAAADAELDRVRHDREVSGKHRTASASALVAELAELAKQLEPLEKEAAIARKRAGEVQDALKRIDRKLAETEALLVSIKGEKLERSAVMAELATLKADRAAVLRDEPEIAAELDALNPRIAAIEASRTEAQRKQHELEQAESEEHKRTAELLDAIGAKRKVVDRAAGDAEAARDRVLFQLGEQLYVDRPPPLTAQLAPIDEIDLELGESERRVMELREILSNVDKAKLARGAAVGFLGLVAVGTFVGWLIYALT
jgi:hypothetical protein